MNVLSLASNSSNASQKSRILCGSISTPVPIFLDISRLIGRSLFGGYTGIDRVEYAYAQSLLALLPERLNFVAYDHVGQIRLLPFPLVVKLLDQIQEKWKSGDGRGAPFLATRLLLSALVGSIPAKQFPNTRLVYLNVSTYSLYFNNALRRLRTNSNIDIISLIHDLIPITHPEYVPASWQLRHKKILRNVAKYSSAIITNSVTTADALNPTVGTDVPIFPLPLGVDEKTFNKSIVKVVSRAPYFVCLGTVEPRKNHITLLHVWRNLAERLGPQTPSLVIIGKRGWECDHIIKLIKVSPHLKHCVTWKQWVPDKEVVRLVSGARALLMPSFVEGFGLPVAEALSLGVPVICSDISAHREIGQSVPDYVSCTDGRGWTEIISDYASEHSSRRAQQLERMNKWHPTSWKNHVEKVIEVIDGLRSPSCPRIGFSAVRGPNRTA
jgi:glycosyltransferase involved in cell wall biosynthesis